MHVIDRRQNPKSKSLGNRQRFMRRVRSRVREAVRDAIRNRKISDLSSSEQVSIGSNDLHEPSFRRDTRAGQREFVLPGNHGYQRGDRIRKPRGRGSGDGKGGSPEGSGEDEFAFTLSSEEFLDLFFEELELPNLAKRKLKTIMSSARARAGYASDGSPSRLNKRETMRRSLSRRIALRRPTSDELEELQRLLRLAEQDQDPDEAARISREIEKVRTRMRAVAFLDRVDLRYNRYEPRPKPTTQAVMFCLMDTSASMTEELKDLAKRFFMLLHVFLTRHYRSVEIVFVRHTYTASEVDEDTFFHGRETGGTVVSSALLEMQRIIRERYPLDDWNIYAAQASDGHNFEHDMPIALQLLESEILPLCQYYAYVEVSDGDFTGQSSALWDGYTMLSEHCDHFEQSQVGDVSEIYPVFHKLFAGTGAR